MRHLIAALLLALPAALGAQEADQQEGEMPEAGATETESGAEATGGGQASEAARTYVESRGMQALIDQTLSTDRVLARIEQSLPPGADPATMEEVRGIVTEELQAVRPDLEAAMRGAADETFDEAELQELTDFYESDLGVTVVTRTPEFISASLESIRPRISSAQEQIQQRVTEVLRAQ